MPPYEITLANFNAGTGSNRLLLVGVEASRNDVVSVSFSGVQLTERVGSFNNDAEFWYFTNPSGTGDIVFTMSGPTSVVVDAYAFSGVDQVNPLPTTTDDHNTGAGDPDVSLTTRIQTVGSSTPHQYGAASHLVLLRARSNGTLTCRTESLVPQVRPS